MSADPPVTTEGPEPARVESPRWREIGVAALFSALLFASFLTLPLLGSLLLAFVAAPVVRATHRGGLAVGIAASALCAALLGILGFVTAAPGAGALLGAFLTGAPALSAAAVHRGVRHSYAYLWLCLGGFLLLSAGLLVREQTAKPTMREEISRAFEEMSQQALQSPSRSQMNSETAERLKRTLAAAKDFAQKYWPGLLGATWVLGSAVGFYTGAWAARPSVSAEGARFDTLRVPVAVVPFFVGAGAGSVALPAGGREIAGSLLLTLSALYFVAGLSIICHFARRWFRARVLRVGLYALVVYVPINVGVALLGLFDWYADFRRRGEGAIKRS